MKNTYIIALILIVALGGLFLWNKSKAPSPTDLADTPSDAAGGTVLEGSGIEVGPDDVPLSGGEDSATGLKEFTVSGKNFSFDPTTISVKKGDRVKITFKSTQGFHDFVVDGYGVATKQMQAPAEEVIEFVADKAGTFEYYCSVGSHRQMGMKGSLVVTE